MSYTPTEWVDGDIITAQKLNKMEGGIASAGGALKLEITGAAGERTITNATYNDIMAAVDAGKVVFVKVEVDTGVFAIAYLIATEYDSSEPSYWVILVADADNAFMFKSSSADGVLVEPK